MKTIDIGALLPSEDQRAMLDEPMPSRVVKERQGGGRTLSYVDTFYVINRLNQVFGNGLWSYEVNLTKSWEGTAEVKGKSSFAVGYLAMCTLRVGPCGAPYCTITDVGSGDGTDPFPPKAHESAAKEAATDALKRCAKSLGLSMGLALYDKEQEHVVSLDDEVKALLTEIEAAPDQASLTLARSKALLLKPDMSKEHKEVVAAALEAAKERLK